MNRRETTTIRRCGIFAMSVLVLLTARSPLRAQVLWPFAPKNQTVATPNGSWRYDRESAARTQRVAPGADWQMPNETDRRYRAPVARNIRDAEDDSSYALFPDDVAPRTARERDEQTRPAAYEWHASRQAPRASEAPAYRTSQAAPRRSDISEAPPYRPSAGEGRSNSISEAPPYHGDARDATAGRAGEAPSYRTSAREVPSYRAESGRAPFFLPSASGARWSRQTLSDAPPFQADAAGALGPPRVALLPERDPFGDGNPPPRGGSSTGRYRPVKNSNSTYELPPGAEAISPQGEPTFADPRGRTTYDSRGLVTPRGEYAPEVSDPNGFGPGGPGSNSYGPGGYVNEDDPGYGPGGYGPAYGDGGDFGPGGYGPDPYGADSYDEYGNPLYLTPCPDCGRCCGGPSCHHHWFDESSVFAGVHAFKGGFDQGQNGNFGFQEGVNFAGSLWHAYGIGYQVGGNWLQSDLSGSNIANSFNNSRQQVFITAGLYRRAICGHGFQGGAVYDWLNDRFYGTSQFSQMRAEVSYIFPYGNEFGFWGAFATGSTQVQQVNQVPLNFKSTNLYTAYYRKNLANGDQGRIWGGYAGNNGGLIGADYRVHMTNAWDLVGGFNYLIPNEGKNSGGSTQEAWGLSMNLVWYPKRSPHGIHNGQFRQLFNVADNNVFMINQPR